MLPLGGGVSKAGGAHGWSNTERHWWCCMGSAIEAFGRLHHATFWLLSEPEVLLVLQLVPSVLRWEARGVSVQLEADVPGEVPRGGGDPMGALEMRLTVASVHARATSRRLNVRLRVPSWAARVKASVGSVAIAAEPRSLLDVQLLADGEPLRLWMEPALELRAATEPLLKAVFFGPVLLAALTRGDRRLFASHGRDTGRNHRAWLQPVPAHAREELRSLHLASSTVTAVLAHDGGKRPIRLVQPPAPLPTRDGRHGGSDEANSASWRLVPAAGSLPSALAGAAPIGLEAFDWPGHYVTAADYSREARLLPATGGGGAAGLGQLWWVRRDAGAASKGLVALESADEAGAWLANRGEGDGSRLVLGARAMVLQLRESFASFPPLSFWASSNISSAKCQAVGACDARRRYLLVPLNGLLDEHYSAHLCVLENSEQPPKWCS